MNCLSVCYGLLAITLWFLSFASLAESAKPGSKHPNLPRAWSLHWKTVTTCFS